VDRNGQQLAAVGDVEDLDITALASLAAGNVAATDSLARLIGESDFSTLFHEGEKDNLHLSVVGGKVILVVIFDVRSSLGLVRLRVKKYSGELAAALELMRQRSAKARSGKMAATSPFAEITDEDIDSLFGN
jgi:predicted regulator of Ras-like GTPase activity (Roadblock/LC7/MglB family)